jgi:hypothetical protein
LNESSFCQPWPPPAQGFSPLGEAMRSSIAGTSVGAGAESGRGASARRSAGTGADGSGVDAGGAGFEASQPPAGPMSVQAICNVMVRAVRIPLIKQLVTDVTKLIEAAPRKLSTRATLKGGLPDVGDVLARIGDTEIAAATELHLLAMEQARFLQTALPEFIRGDFSRLDDARRFDFLGDDDFTALRNAADDTERAGIIDTALSGLLDRMEVNKLLEYYRRSEIPPETQHASKAQVDKFSKFLADRGLTLERGYSWDLSVVIDGEKGTIRVGTRRGILLPEHLAEVTARVKKLKASELDRARASKESIELLAEETKAATTTKPTAEITKPKAKTTTATTEEQRLAEQIAAEEAARRAAEQAANARRH